MNKRRTEGDQAEEPDPLVFIGNRQAHPTWKTVLSLRMGQGISEPVCSTPGVSSMTGQYVMCGRRSGEKQRDLELARVCTG